MVDVPFKLDSRVHLPWYVSRESYQTILDDKSRYDHLLLTKVGLILGSNEVAGISSTTHSLSVGRFHRLSITQPALWQPISSVLRFGSEIGSEIWA